MCLSYLCSANSKGPGRAKLGGAAAGGILALILLVGALAVLWYCGQRERKKYRSRVLIRNKNLVDQFILRYNNIIITLYQDYYERNNRKFCLQQ